MRSLFPLFFAATQVASVFATSPVLAAAPSRPTPMLCSTAFDWYNRTYLGVKADGTMPKGFQKSTYDYEGLKRNFNFAEEHLYDRVKNKRIAPEVMATVKDDYAAFTKIQNEKFGLEMEVRSLNRLRGEINDQEGGTGLNELKSRVKAELDEKTKKIEAASTELQKLRGPLKEKLAKAGIEDSGNGLFPTTEEEENQLTALRKSPATKALSDAMGLLGSWYKEKLGNVEVTVVAREKAPEPPKKKMSPEESRKLSELRDKVSSLEIGARRYPDVKSIQEELSRSKEALKRMDTTEPQFFRLYDNRRDVDVLKTVMIRKAGIPSRMTLGEYHFACDDSGQITRVSSDANGVFTAKDCVYSKTGETAEAGNPAICFLFFNGPTPPEPTPAPTVAPAKGAIR